MTHPYDLLPGDISLIFTPCPGTKGTGLLESLHTLKAAGADCVISVMPTEELKQSGAESIESACNAAGMDWYHLPVADDHAPATDFDKAWQTHAEEILRRLNAGECAAIHCQGGSGRTGLVAATLLLNLGLPLTEATLQVQSLRPRALQHPLHRQWLEQTASQLASGEPS